jgi:hypothetical protein
MAGDSPLETMGAMYRLRACNNYDFTTRERRPYVLFVTTLRLRMREHYLYSPHSSLRVAEEGLPEWDHGDITTVRQT